MSTIITPAVVLVELQRYMRTMRTAKDKGDEKMCFTWWSVTRVLGATFGVVGLSGDC
jgi:hypothetical protein